MSLPLGAFALIAAGWCAFWFYAAAKAEETIAGWLDREAKLGRVYTCGSRTIGGFPFRIEVRCDNAAANLTSPQPPLSLTLQDVLIAAQIYQPTLLISEFSGPLTLSGPGQPETVVNWTLARTSVRGLPRTPERISISLDGAMIERVTALGTERLFTSEHVEAHTRLASGTLADHPVFDLALRCAATTAPGLHPFAAQPIDADIDATLRGLKDIGPKPLTEQLREIQESGGRIEIKSARVKQGEWLAVGAGSLGLTPDGMLDGELRLTVAGLDKLLQAFGVEYMARPGAGSARLNSAFSALDRLAPGLGTVAREHAGAGLAAGFALLGEPAELEGQRAVHLPLRFDRGMAFLGPVPIGQTKALF